MMKFDEAWKVTCYRNQWRWWSLKITCYRSRWPYGTSGKERHDNDEDSGKYPLYMYKKKTSLVTFLLSFWWTKEDLVWGVSCLFDGLCLGCGIDESLLARSTNTFCKKKKKRAEERQDQYRCPLDRGGICWLHNYHLKLQAQLFKRWIALFTG